MYNTHTRAVTRVPELSHVCACIHTCTRAFTRVPELPHVLFLSGEPSCSAPHQLIGGLNDRNKNNKCRPINDHTFFLSDNNNKTRLQMILLIIYLIIKKITLNSNSISAISKVLGTFVYTMIYNYNWSSPINFLLVNLILSFFYLFYFIISIYLLILYS